MTEKFLRLPEKDARDVLVAELLEEAPGEKNPWSRAEADAATRDARHLAGENAGPARFLPLRARLVLARMKEIAKPEAAPSVLEPAAGPVAFLLGVAAYLAGVMTDRLATTGSVINLLAPPLLAFLLWNLFVYAALLLRLIPAVSRRLRPPVLRGAVAYAMEKFRLPGIRKGSLRTRFWLRWGPLLAHRISLFAARALHGATLLFAVGMMTSIAVRGIGTAYVVGWESTWLADRPDLVASVIHAAYGLLPTGFPGVLPLPDASAIGAMNLATGGSAPASESASWLLRLMGLLAGWVILPRAFLVLLDTLRIRRDRKALAFPVGSDYYRRLLTEPDASRSPELVLLHPRETEVNTFWPAFEREMTELLGGWSVRRIPVSVWEDEPNDVAARVLEGASVERRLVLIQDAAATPEEEVHGAFIRALPKPLHLWLDASSLRSRFGAESPSVRSRLALWETFAHGHGAAPSVVSLDSASEREAAARALLA